MSALDELFDKSYIANIDDYATKDIGELFYVNAEKAAKELAALRSQNDKMEAALLAIEQWCKAYPLSVFPEPDFEHVKVLLGESLLTRVSVSNMRHVIKGVEDLVKDGLAEIGD